MRHPVGSGSAPDAQVDRARPHPDRRIVTGPQPDSYTQLGFLLSRSWTRSLPWSMEASSPTDHCSEDHGLDHRSAAAGRHVRLCLDPHADGLVQLTLATRGAHVPASGEPHVCSSTSHVCTAGIAPCTGTIRGSNVDKWWIHMSTHRSPLAGSTEGSVPTDIGTV